MARPTTRRRDVAGRRQDVCSASTGWHRAPRAAGLSTVIVLVCAIFLVWDARAEAYLDPGSGSMLIQLVLGGVAGLLVILKLYWRRLLALIGVRSRDEAEKGGDA